MSLSRASRAALLLGNASGNVLQSSSMPVSSQAHVHTAVCSTVLGLTSVASVPTTTITQRIHDPSPVVVFTTVQDTVTVTPTASTLTATDYETTTVTSTASTVTDVFSTTSTEYDTATVTVTPDDITSTIFVTVPITLTTTSTVATSDGFTPIVDTLTTTTAIPLKRSFEPSLDSDCSPILDDYKYAQEVVCHEKVILKTTTISTVTEAPAITTAAAASTTVTETSTITTSSVVVPDDVSTTLSYDTTSTITETSTADAVTDTVTSTTTVTAAISTTSAYAACATNNIAGAPLSSDYGALAGEYLYSFNWGSIAGYTSSVAVSTSAEACCVSCQENSACAFTFYYEPTTSAKYCYMIKTTTCSGSSNYGYGSVSSTELSYNFQASNGNCGQVRKYPS